MVRLRGGGAYRGDETTRLRLETSMIGMEEADVDVEIVLAEIEDDVARRVDGDEWLDVCTACVRANTSASVPCGRMRGVGVGERPLLESRAGE